MTDAPPDVAVVGAGPAGLAAAAMCANLGLITALIDEQPAEGGQIYRGAGDVGRDIPGTDYRRGASLV